MTYGLRNNATTKLTAGIGTTSTSVSVTAGEGGLFIDNSIATLEHKDSDGNVVKREVVLITNISGDTLTIQRAYGPCVIDDTAENKEMQATAQSFSVGDTLSIYVASEVIQDLYTPAQQVADLCTCICNCHDTRMQQARQKMLDCYGDISYGTGCDGDCILEGEVFLDATKEYEFRNLTICAGACVRFVGSGIPKIHVSGNFISNGTIDLRGGCPVGTNSFTNCFGTVSNNYCATCYNAMKYGCGGCGGTSPYTTLTDGPKGGDGGSANYSSSCSGTGGRGGYGCCIVACTRGCYGHSGGLCCGGGGGGSAGILFCTNTTGTNGCAGCDSNGYNGGNGGTTPCAWSGCRAVSGGAGGGGGGGYWTGNGGNGGCGKTQCTTGANRKLGGIAGGDGGNGGIWGNGGVGGSGHVCQMTTCSYYGCCYQYGGRGGNGGNGYIGGRGGGGYLCGNVSTQYTGRTCGGNGGCGVVSGGNGGSVYFYPNSGCCFSYAKGGNGGNAINNMYGLVLRARNFCNCIICGTGGNGGIGGGILCCSSVLSSGTCLIGGNGGKGANGAKIMIFYKTAQRKGTITCAGGTGGTGGQGATHGTAGTAGTAGCLIYCQRDV